MNSNNVLCLRHYRLATLLELTVPNVDSQLVTESRVRVRVTLRLAVYRQSVCLGAKSSEAHDQGFFLGGATEPLRS
jgi:hypothetical protein